MRGIIMHDNGRLKTGRVSLLFFLGLVLGLGLLFHLHKPVDEAIVVVRHIFAATPKNKTEKPLSQKPQRPISKTQSEPPKVAQTSSAKVLKETVAKNHELPLEPIPLHVKTSTLKDVSQKVVPAANRMVQDSLKAVAEITEPEPPKKIAMDTVQTNKKISGQQPAKDLPDELKTAKTAVSDTLSETPAKNLSESIAPQPEKKPVKAEAATTQSPAKRASLPGSSHMKTVVMSPVAMEPEELVIDYQQVFSETVTTQNSSVTLMSESARQLIRDNLPTKNLPPGDARKKAFTTAQRVSNKRVEAGENPDKQFKKPIFKLASAKTSTLNKSIQAKGIIVEKEEYAALHQAWREVGEGESENDRIIPLRIENLRSAYNLLQMKAVVIKSDNSCLDLSDGSRIPRASLDRFSSTVMQIDDPWQKWGVELRRAGLRPGQSFQIRYYLYDFVKRSIYARVNQAYNWSLKTGLLPAATKPSEVDVLGRAYIVERSSGGLFGVFVPRSLATRDGRIINIDPLCFHNAPDVVALHAAGII